MLSRETQVGNAPLHKASGQVAADQESGSSGAVLLSTDAFPGAKRLQCLPSSWLGTGHPRAGRPGEGRLPPAACQTTLWRVSPGSVALWAVLLAINLQVKRGSTLWARKPELSSLVGLNSCRVACFPRPAGT